MSWRGSGSSGGSGYRSRNDEGSVFSGGSAGGPPLQLLIAAVVGLGVILLLAAIFFTPRSAPVQVAAPTPTEAPAPTAAPAPTEAPAAAGGGAAGAGGSLATEGEGEPLAIAAAPAALAFAETALSAPADTLVTLTFTNENDLGVQHNWVLVDGGDDVAAAVNTAAQGNSAGLYVPPAGTEGALAYTAMVNDGETGSVTFTTPAAGTYLYICTFPGHYLAGMQGDLTVTP